jgi:hypothetical protein
MLLKYVKRDGTGDYTTITTAFNDMLVSGLAASGDITTYTMIVDGGSYSGTISGFIPYSGTFNIIGSGTYWCLVSGIGTVSGNYSYSYAPNLYIEGFTIDCSGLPNYWFTVPSGFGLSVKNTQLINNSSGVLNYGGTVQFENLDSYGINNKNYFLYDISGGTNVVTNCSISNYGTGIYCTNPIIHNSCIHDNYVGVYYGNSFTIDIFGTLMYGNTYADINVGSGTLYLTNSTFNSPIYINNAFIYADKIISKTSVINISGGASTGSVVENSCLYPGSTLATTISGGYNIHLDPKFNDSTNRDYRLQFKQTDGSPCVEIKPNLNLDSSITYDLDATKLRIFDSRGLLKTSDFLQYIYTQDDTIVFSDYNRELTFADLVSNYKNLRYELYVNMVFDEYNVNTYPSFDINFNNPDLYPWDWDIITLKTTEIKDYNNYIIPRSVINIEDVMGTKLGIIPNAIFYRDIVKDNIKVYNKYDYRGISYDYNQSHAGRNIMWVIDGTNQSLIKQNLYTGEELEYYPLLCQTPTKSVIRPSGLIYTGVKGDYYTFILSDDPNKKIIGLTELGDFNWIPTNMNTKFDLRGAKVFKDNIFIAAGQYPLDITNRNIIPTGEPIGKLLQYNTNDLFMNYIKYPAGEDNGPVIHTLASGNYYPTDITVYEDGTFLIADYYSASGIYKYKLAYDYALIQSNYDDETKVLLREQYDDVDL